MPEFYIEPLTDRWVCFKCSKTSTGKKKLFKCGGCEAITYCSVECQREDWPRHAWNCIPVMVTEIPGKGRGLVAARDIKMGELIFKEEPSIKLSWNPTDPAFMKSLMDQVDNLPEEAKAQLFKLKPRTFSDIRGNPRSSALYQIVASNTSQSEYKIFGLCEANSDFSGSSDARMELFLNFALVNHSCAPNAAIGDPNLTSEEEDDCIEIRAIKDISKGEEITSCYFLDVKEFGSIQRKRKAGLKKDLFFDCKCSVCLGKVPCQEKILKKLIELHNKLDPAPSDWKRDVSIRDKIADLTLQLYMGQPREKCMALLKLALSAHYAGDQGLLRKFLDKVKQLAEDTKLEEVQQKYEMMERKFGTVD